MRHVLEERADKTPRNLIARIDHSPRLQQESRPEALKQFPPLPSQQPASLPDLAHQQPSVNSQNGLAMGRDRSHRQ